MPCAVAANKELSCPASCGRKVCNRAVLVIQVVVLGSMGLPDIKVTTNVLPADSVMPGPMLLAYCPVKSLMLCSCLPPRHSASSFLLQLPVKSLMLPIEVPVQCLVPRIDFLMETRMFGV